jgi:HlyD family secretion protein
MERLPRISLLVAALALSLAAPLPLRAQDAPDAAAITLPAITVSTVQTRLLRDRVVGAGLVTPVERVLVQPLIEGQPIESLEAEVGDKVEQGQVLARLSSSTLRLQESQFAASRASAEAAIAQSEAQLLEARSIADEATHRNARPGATGIAPMSVLTAVASEAGSDGLVIGLRDGAGLARLRPLCAMGTGSFNTVLPAWSVITRDPFFITRFFPTSTCRWSRSR